MYSLLTFYVVIFFQSSSLLSHRSITPHELPSWSMPAAAVEFVCGEDFLPTDAPWGELLAFLPEEGSTPSPACAPIVADSGDLRFDALLGDGGRVSSFLAASGDLRFGALLGDGGRVPSRIVGNPDSFLTLVGVFARMSSLADGFKPGFKGCFFGGVAAECLVEPFVSTATAGTKSSDLSLANS